MGLGRSGLRARLMRRLGDWALGEAGWGRSFALPAPDTEPPHELRLMPGRSSAPWERANATRARGSPSGLG